MQRKLYKCPYCKEWFNTTTEIMIEHILAKHREEIHPVRLAQLVSLTFMIQMFKTISKNLRSA